MLLKQYPEEAENCRDPALTEALLIVFLQFFASVCSPTLASNSVAFDFYSLAQQPKYRFSIQRSSKSATTEQTTTFTLGNTFVSRFKANLPAK